MYDVTDTLTPFERSERMSRVRGKGTKPEMLVRKLVYGMGYRYRLHANDLPGKPDMVFRSRKAAIFVHGCYWHRHKNCKLARLPKSRLDFWLPKLEGNRVRDEQNQALLKEMGWRCLVVWECETKDKEALMNKVSEFMSACGGNEQ